MPFSPETSCLEPGLFFQSRLVAPEAKSELGLEMPFPIVWGIPFPPFGTLLDPLLPGSHNIFFLDAQDVSKEARGVFSHEM